MKLYIEIQKEVTEWVESKIQIPKSFNVSLKTGDSKDYNTIKSEWIKEKIELLKGNEKIRNIIIEKDCILYEKLSSEYEDDLEIEKISTLEELLNIINKYNLHSLYEDSGSSWRLSE